MSIAGNALVVGISGGSAAGKTTLASDLVAALSDFSPVVLNQDHYFRDWEDVPPDRRDAERTSNHPRAVLWEVLTAHVQALRQGLAIALPTPGTRAYRRADAPRSLLPGKVVFVEGHLIFGHEALRALMDVRIFLDVDTHERVLRRMLRDTSRGNMTLEGAVAWYRRDVIPNYPIYTAATRHFADVIVPYEGNAVRAVEVLGHGLRAMAHDRGVSPDRL